MHRYISTIIVTLLLWQFAAAKDVVQFTGVASFTITGTERPVRFTIRTQDLAEILSLRFEDAPANAASIFRQSYEKAQMQAVAAYARNFGAVGTMLCVELAEGAGSSGLSVIAARADGRFVEVFHCACRFGYEIVDTDGDSVPEIVGWDGDLPGPYTATIYKWNGTEFGKTRVMPVPTPRVLDVHIAGTPAEVNGGAGQGKKRP